MKYLFYVLLTCCFFFTRIEIVMGEDCLFLAHLNKSSKAEVAKGGGKIQAQRVEVNGGAGYKFKDSFPVPGGLDLRKRGGNVIYPAPGNIDTRQGTIQFWIKPQWIRKSKKKPYLSMNRILAVGFDPQKRQKLSRVIRPVVLVLLLLIRPGLIGNFNSVILVIGKQLGFLLILKIGKMMNGIMLLLLGGLAGRR